jgi:hypothetical protein
MARGVTRALTKKPRHEKVPRRHRPGMRTISAAAAFLGVLTVAGVTWACGPEPVQQVFVQPVRPVQVVDARELLLAATSADNAAARDEAAGRAANQRAASFDQRAQQVLGRAHRLPHGRERARLLREADNLQTEAAIERADAGDLLASAARLRHRARDLREQARFVTAGGGGGWRGKSTPHRTPRGVAQI